MIKIILFLCRFNFVNNFVSVLSISYQARQKKVGQVKTLEQFCQEELNKLNKNEKKAIIYYQPN